MDIPTRTAGRLLRRALGRDDEALEEIRRNTLVAFAVFALFALVATVWKGPGLLRARSSASWPTVVATVADVTRYKDGQICNLKYVVGGEVFLVEGERVEPGWQAGTPVTLYHDPGAPGIARRTAGWGPGDTAGLTLLIVVWLGAAGLGWTLVRRFRLASHGILETDE